MVRIHIYNADWGTAADKRIAEKVSTAMLSRTFPGS
jgi:hypothetical protein